MTIFPANASANPIRAEKISDRSGVLGPRHRTAFAEWLASQPDGNAAAIAKSSRTGHSSAGRLPSTPKGEMPPLHRSFRTRGGTPPAFPDDSATPGFERCRSRVAPHLVRYLSVPDTAKFPSGPYHQAPTDRGGEWWLVNPFTGREPWLRLEQVREAPTEEALPEGFADIFGPRPTRNEFPDYFDFRLGKMEWEHDLKFFKQAGIPPGLDETQLQTAGEAFVEWGLGEPVFYEGRHGWRARFPDSDVLGFEVSPTTAVQAPHIAVAKYQIRLIQQGDTPLKPHPWLPPQMLTPGEKA